MIFSILLQSLGGYQGRRGSLAACGQQGSVGGISGHLDPEIGSFQRAGPGKRRVSGRIGWVADGRGEDVRVESPQEHSTGGISLSTPAADRVYSSGEQAGMTVDSDIADNTPDPEQQKEIEDLIERCMQRCAGGEVLDEEQVISQHEDLMPELGERLQAMRMILDVGKPGLSDDDETLTIERIAPDSEVSVLRDAIPGYEILHQLHRGGQGAVYLAIQKGTKRKVAVKVMREGPFAGAKDKVRFEREIRILGALKHPNIATIYESGVTPYGHYYTMDYVSGLPLDRHISKYKLRVNDILELFVQVCEAVNAAHLKGVVHRDLKPGNILVDEDGKPCVLDFGLARVAASVVTDDSHPEVMTLTGQFVGSLPWAAPEQAEGKSSHIDTRTDVYSLGVLLYQLLTGTFPYAVVGTPQEILDNILHRSPERPSTASKGINNEVEMIVLKALSKERERRYQTAGELARDIGHYLAGEPIEAKRDSTWYVVRKSLRRHRSKAFVATTFTVAVLAAVFAGQWIWSDHGPATGGISSAPKLDLQRASYEIELNRNINNGVPRSLFEPPSSQAIVDTNATLYRVMSVPPKQLCAIIPNKGMYELQVVEILYDTLFLRSPYGEYLTNPAIVEGELEWQDDQRTVTVGIRPDARWHDGHALTADDIVFSWHVLEKLGKTGELIASMTARGSDLVVQFLEEVAVPEKNLNFDLIPKHIYESVDLEQDKAALLRELESLTPQNEALIGNGPYRLLKSTEAEIVLERWPAYPGASPHFRTVNIRIEDDPDERLDLFLNGTVDELSPTDAQYSRFRDMMDPQLGGVGYPVSFVRNQFNVVLWNIRKRPELFGDPRVRQALAHAFNLRQAMRSASLDPQDHLASIFTPKSWVYEVVEEQIIYSPEKARTLLDEAGWHDQDGVLVRRSEPGEVTRFRFSLAVLQSSETSVKMMTALTRDLGSIGIEAELQLVDRDEWWIGLRDANFDATITGFSLSIEPDLDRGLWHSADAAAKPGSPVSFGYGNSEVDNIFDLAARELDSGQRRELYLQVQELVYADQPVLFLYCRSTKWLLSRRLRGVEFGMDGPFRFHPGVRAWWTPK